MFYATSIGYHVVTRYADIEAVFSDPATYSAAAALAPLVPLVPEAQKIHAVLAEQAPDLLRRDRDIDVADAEVPQRIDDRVGDRGGRADGGRLADALGADRMVG